MLRNQVKLKMLFVVIGISALSACGDPSQVAGVAASDTPSVNQSGYISTLIGDGSYGLSAEGSSSLSSQLRFPSGVAQSNGSIFIYDSNNYRIRMMPSVSGTYFGISMAANAVYTVAGNGSPGYNGDGGVATAANLEGTQANGIAADTNGNVFLTDNISCVVRMVPAASGVFFGISMISGKIYTIAGNSSVCGSYTGDGGVATSAGMKTPNGIAVDSSGNVYVADTGNQAIRIIPRTTGVFFGASMAVGHIYTLAGNGSNGSTGDGGIATSAQLNDPYGVSVDANMNVFIADYSNNKVRMIAAASGTFFGRNMTGGNIYTIAGINTVISSGGDGSVATTAGVKPSAVATDSIGNVYELEVLPSVVRMICHSPGVYFGISMQAGFIYNVAGDRTRGYTGDGGLAGSAQMSEPYGLTTLQNGSILVADFDNNVIRNIQY